MRLADLSARRIFFPAALLPSRRRRSPYLIRATISLRVGSMADESEENGPNMKRETEYKTMKEWGNPTPTFVPEKPNPTLLTSVPPPPEKPLPGDCCGSGCVRCVWDVYYEELEEYNRLYQTK